MTSSRTLAVIALLSCGRTPTLRDPQHDPPTGRGGWSLLASTPYARVGHASIVDPVGDRLIVFGGAANDTWALPLAGGAWSRLAVEGPHPPPHAWGAQLYGDAAVYDPYGRRMLLLLNRKPTTAVGDSDVELWQLGLDAPETWSRLEPAGPKPGSEIQSGRLAIDTARKRLLVLGGALTKSGVWALSLDGEPAWSRVAGAPERDAFYTDHSIFYDAATDQLLLLGGHASATLWALSLSTLQWSAITKGQSALHSYGQATAFDPASRTLVLVGGDWVPGLDAFSLATGVWTRAAGEQLRGASAALDAARGRVLVFGGAADHGNATDALRAVSLDTFATSTVREETSRADFRLGSRHLVLDADRGLVAFGGYEGPVTHVLGETLQVGETPAVSYAAAIYDPVDRAIVSFGGYNYTETAQVWRLASQPGAQWAQVLVDGPGARSSAVSGYDARRGRLVVFGGVRNSSYPPQEFLADTWALTLGASPAWSQLGASTPGPGPRWLAVGAVDSEGDRLIVIGGYPHGDVNPGLWSTTAWALPLDGTGGWSQLDVAGEPLSALAPESWGIMMNPQSAVFDAAHHRMIIVDQRSSGARVFALELGGAVTLHRFCPGSSSLTPAPTSGFPGSSANVVLRDDGVVLVENGATFVFSLDTPYCGL